MTRIRHIYVKEKSALKNESANGFGNLNSDKKILWICFLCTLLREDGTFRM